LVEFWERTKAPAALPLVRGRGDGQPLWGGRPKPLLPYPGQVL
jgi:hypothetical protein